MPTEVRVLGTICVTTASVCRELQADKAARLMAVLALEAGQVVSYDDLATDLWPDGLPLQPRNAMQATVTRIRRTLHLSPDAIRAVRTGYLLDIDPCRVDSNRFLALTSSAAATIGKDPAAAGLLLEESLTLWRGRALTGLDASLKCRSEAIFLEERRITALRDLARVRILLRDEQKAIPDLQRLVLIYPTRERLVELLMLALYRVGRQTEALALYHKTRQHLDRELGIAPGPTLVQIYLGILAQDPAADWFDEKPTPDDRR